MRITAKSNTLIDVILSNKSSNISSNNVISLSLIDHDYIVCVRKINHKKTPPREIICKNYRHYDLIVFNNDLKNLDWLSLFTCSSTNNASNILEQILTRIIYNQAPKMKKTINRRRCLRLSTETKNNKDEREKVLRKAMKRHG